MRILADTNVPEEYAAALRGDGHDIVFSRAIDELGPEATDDAIASYAEREELSLLSTDVKISAIKMQLFRSSSHCRTCPVAMSGLRSHG